jgi:hypothetical protein
MKCGCAPQKFTIYLNRISVSTPVQVYHFSPLCKLPRVHVDAGRHFAYT